MHLRTNIRIQNLMYEVGLPEFSILNEHRESRCDTNYKKSPNVLASQPACLLLCKVQRENCTSVLWKPSYLFTDQWLSPETWSHASKLRFLNLDTQQHRSAVCELYCECPKGGSLKLNTSWILQGFNPRPMTTVRCSSQLFTMWGPTSTTSPRLSSPLPLCTVDT